MHTDIDSQEHFSPPGVSTTDHPPMHMNAIISEKAHLFPLVEGHSPLGLGEDHLNSLHCARSSSFSSSTSSNKQDDSCTSQERVVSPLESKRKNKRIQRHENKRLNEGGSDSEVKKSKSSAKAEKHKEKGPKLVVRTRSEVDVINDGYKWRKYGQKAVKHSSHARSYYRCTNKQCRVKKQVERYASDPEFVVTTYDGVHNHTGPALFQIVNRPIFISKDSFPIPLDYLQMSASAPLSLFGNSYDQLMEAQASSGNGGGGGLLEDVLPPELRKHYSP